ncbi:TPA: hypothetical protein DEP90_01135 [Patescibacteria group bacterium]|nr:hypothetical protein [Patescibacteria group bacterium]
MSILLKKAIKLSLLPAVLMIAGKFLGLFTLIAVYGIQFNVGNEVTGIFSTQIFLPNIETTLFVNSISDLVMISILGVFTIYMILQTTILQNTKNNPRTIAKVVKFNILKWVTSSTSTFLKIFIWTSFVVISSIIVIINTLQGDTYLWIGITAGVISLLCIWGLMKTFEIETEKIYPSRNKHSYF